VWISDEKLWKKVSFWGEPAKDTIMGDRTRFYDTPIYGVVVQKSYI
jgi:hypothetical protein